MPLNITFQTLLGCYSEPVLDVLAKELSKYEENPVEIGLCELKMDADFIKQFCKLQNNFKARSKNGIKIKYEIKTTGAGIREEHLEFFKANEIKICLLMDGPEEIHECSNSLLKREAPHQQAVLAARLLKKYEVDFYLGITVTSVVAVNIERVYSFFSENNWNSQAYWPILCDTKPEAASKLLTEAKYGYFLEKLFYLWKNDRMGGRPVYVREFENFAGSVKGYELLVSSISGRCPFQNLFLPDGSIYTRGCLEGQKEYLGKQLEVQNLQVINSENIQDKCRQCRWVSLCQSDRTCCKNSSAFCKIYKEFYLSALPDMFEVLRCLGR